MLRLIPALLCILFVASSCDPTYTIEYEITNRSSGHIDITYNIRFQNNESTAQIPPETKLQVFEDFQLGITSAEEIIADNRFPYDELIITNQDGKKTKDDLLQMSSYRVSYDKKSDAGMVHLLITDNSF